MTNTIDLQFIVICLILLFYLFLHIRQEKRIKEIELELLRLERV